jgi:uncharacterized protein YcbX
MMGEELDAAEVTERGLLGDRAYALVDTANSKVASAKSANKWGKLLDFRAAFVAPPRLGENIPAVRITLPDGAVVDSEQPEANKVMSRLLGRDVTLMSMAPAGSKFEFPAGTVAGQYATVTEFPIAAGAPSGTFFDYAVVHLVTTASVSRLQQMYPTGRFETQRFRPNIVVTVGNGGAGFIENSWIKRTLRIGNDVLLRITMPCPRCVMTTLPQRDLPHDPEILRTAARHNMLNLGEFGDLPCLGVYADVLRSGAIRRGDPVGLD